MSDNTAIAERQAPVSGLPESLLQDVAQEIRRQAGSALLVLTRSVGQLLIDRFYDGDMAKAHQRGATDNTLRSLADLLSDIPGLSSAVSLYRCIGVHEVASRLEAAGVPPGKHLTPRHFRAVFPLPAARQIALLRVADEESWTVEELEKAAAKYGDGEDRPGGRRGRKPLPVFVKSIHRLARNLADDADLFGDESRLAQLDPEQVDELVAEVERVRAKCEAMAAWLKAGRPGGA